MDEKSYIDLVTLQKTLKAGVESALPGRFWVKAEIAALKVNRQSGHCYIDLSQSSRGRVVAKTGAVIWASRYAFLSHIFKEETGTELSAGVEVLLLVTVSYHQLWGLSLSVEDIDPAFTVGQARLQMQQTIERLQREGLMDLQKELCLPELPRRLAVVSAPDAAGLGDFRRHLIENEYGFAYVLDLFPAVMQGEAAPESIAQAIGEASGGGYDAVLIMRGGGSDLDLACFDDYGLAVAIANCPVPVITAIGHDKDHHVADMVSNASVKTPTALADMFLELSAEQDRRIGSLENRLAIAFRARLASAETALAALEARTVVSAARRIDGADSRLELLQRRTCGAASRRLDGAVSRLGLLQNRISGASSRKIDSASSKIELLTALIGKMTISRLDGAEAKLDYFEMKIASTDPRNVLRRGVPIVTDGDGVRFDSVRGRRSGDHISVRLPDGRLDCTVDGVSAEMPGPAEEKNIKTA